MKRLLNLLQLKEKRLKRVTLLMKKKLNKVL